MTDTLQSKARETLLVVDDEPTNLSVLNSILSAHYQVLAARSGELALQIAFGEPTPDLILLDVRMPELNGYAVLERLKRDPRTRSTPVIFVTSADSQQNEEEGLALGAVDYITKPIQPAILLARVRTQLSLKQAHDFLNDHNAFLQAEVDRRIADIQITQDVSIRALAHLAETRDPETGNHILRTQSYVEHLAVILQDHPRFRELLTERFISLMTKSAPLHDIGKVGIPDSVLLKPGQLNAKEWAVMRTHAVLGAQAIEQAETDVDRPVEFLEVAKQIARWHHERWDGRGYPDGLAGDDIPLAARLMAIADVFDAVISPRVYKSALSFDEARRIIEKGQGSHFDPDVAAAFLTHFDEFVAIARRYGDRL